MSKPRTLKELTIKAHDMKMPITNHRGKPSTSCKFKKDKGEIKKSSKPSKASAKESIATSIEEPIQISRKYMPGEKKDHPRGMLEGSDQC